MPRRVLVARSEPGASETAGRLRAIGYEAIVEPLFALAPLDADIANFDALAFTSANGVRRFAQMTPRRDVPVFCVGARTAEAAREAGFGQVASADGDVEALSRLVAARLAPGARLLHAGNEESRGDLAGRLAAGGIDARFVAIFRAIPVASPGPRLAAHLRGEPQFDAVLIHSPRAAAILAGFASAEAGRAPIEAVAISPAAAAPLAGIARRIEVATGPNESALISGLARLVSG